MLHIIIIVIGSGSIWLLKWWRWLSTSIGNEVGALNFTLDEPYGFMTNITISRYHNPEVARKIKTLSVKVVAQCHAMEEAMTSMNTKNKVHKDKMC